MASTPNYTNAVHVETGVLSASNSNRDGTGTVVTVFTAGTNGSRVERITIQATGTTTAGMVRLFVHDGTNTRLWKEVTIEAVTPSATAPAFRKELTNQSLLLPEGWLLRASTHNANNFIVLCEGGHF